MYLSETRMTANEFRKLALSFPEAVEASHMDHPDFRGGKIFATLCAEEKWGMVKLSAADQAMLVGAEPEVFRPANGAWGRNGATIVQLKPARKVVIRQALAAAWRNTATRRLVQEHDL